MPRTTKEWDFVAERIDLNFGQFFKEIPRDGLILDVPCGVGYLEYYLLKKGYVRIHAVDLSEEQIQIAKSKLHENKLEYEGKVKFLLADAFKYLKRHERRFSAIAAIDFLEHLSKNKILELLRLSYRALQPHGLLFVRVINAENPMWGRYFYHDFTHETPFTRDTLQQCLSITGFEVIKVGYEVVPVIHGSKLKLRTRLMQAVRWMGLWLLGKFLGIIPQAFTEDLIAVARRR